MMVEKQFVAKSAVQLIGEAGARDCESEEGARGPGRRWAPAPPPSSELWVGARLSGRLSLCCDGGLGPRALRTRGTLLQNGLSAAVDQLGAAPPGARRRRRHRHRRRRGRGRSASGCAPRRLARRRRRLRTGAETARAVRLLGWRRQKQTSQWTVLSWRRHHGRHHPVLGLPQGILGASTHKSFVFVLCCHFVFCSYAIFFGLSNISRQFIFLKFKMQSFLKQIKHF